MKLNFKNKFSDLSRYLFKKALLEDELAEFERQRQKAEAAAVAVEAKEDEVIEEDTPNAEAQIQTTQPKKSSEPIGELLFIGKLALNLKKNEILIYRRAQLGKRF